MESRPPRTTTPNPLEELAKRRTEERRRLEGKAGLKSKLWHALLWSMGISLGVGLGVISGLGAIVILWQHQLPITRVQLREFRPKEASVVLAADGQQIASFADEDRRIVTLRGLPPHVSQAFLAIEDRRFYSHGAMDLPRVFGALWADIRYGRVRQGSSTITMQLARNTYPQFLPSRDRGLGRKIREILVAREMEDVLSKREILERYLNTIYLGRGAYGIERGAETYFGVRAESLSISQAALLAALPKAPSANNPVTNPRAALARRNLVLESMVRAHFITPGQGAQAKQEALGVRRGAMAGVAYTAQTAPYFIDAVRRELTTTLGDRLYVGGLRVYTTLDRRVQASAEQSLLLAMDSLAQERHHKGSLENTEGAVVFLNTTTGDVEAMVGGRSWDGSQFNRATQSRRQMGSSFKPVVYAAAIDAGLHPWSEISDDPIGVPMSDGSVWSPRSYEGKDEGGMVTIERALALSKNRATVRLALDIGLNAVRAEARMLGMGDVLTSGPSVVLGAGGSNPLEVAGAYSAFGRNGTRVAPRYVTRVEAPDGTILWRRGVQAYSGIDSVTAGVVRGMMTSVVTWGTAAGVRAIYKGVAAGKTGTTNESRDLWFVGLTPGRIGVVWLGLDSDKPLGPGTTGGRWAAPVWARVMAQVPDLGSWPTIVSQVVREDTVPKTMSVDTVPAEADMLLPDTTLSVDSGPVKAPARDSVGRRHGIIPIEPQRDSIGAGRPEAELH